MPAAAGLPQAVTDAEKTAMGAFLDWVADLGDWGDALAARAAKTQEGCVAPPH